MVSVTKYSTVQSQNNARLTRGWENLGNLVANNNNDARANNISTKGAYSNTQNIYLKGFGFNIPTNARIDNIRVEYEHFTTNNSGAAKDALNIGGPVVSFHNIGGGGKRGPKPNPIRVSVPTSQINWKRSGTFKPTPAQLNSPNFGLTINYPSNVGKNKGVLRIDFIRVRVDYTVTSVDPAVYSISMSSPQPVTLGENVSFDITLNNSNGTNSNGTSPVSITVPAGLEFVSASGHGSFNSGTGVWTAQLSGKISKTRLTFKTISTGVQSITATTSTNVSVTRGVTVSGTVYTINSTLPSSITQGTGFEYTIDIQVNTASISSVSVHIPFGADIGYIAHNSGSFNTSTNIWTAQFVNQTASITFIASMSSAGEFSQTITSTDEYNIVKTLTNTINSIAANLTVTYDASIPFSTDVLENMEDGEEYIAAFYARIVDTDTPKNAIINGPKNNRFSVLQRNMDQLQTIGEVGQSISGSTPLKLRQSFIPTKPNLSGIKLRIRRWDAPYESITFGIYASDGTTLIEEKTISGADIPLDITDLIIEFDSTLTPGETHYIKINKNGVGGYSVYTGLNNYPDGTFETQHPITGEWTTYGSLDMFFVTYFDTIPDEDIHEEYLSNPITTNTDWELLTAQFTCNKNVEQSFRFYAGYTEYHPEDISVEFSQEPVIIPAEIYNGFTKKEPLFSDKDALISNTPTTITLDALEKTGTYLFSDIDTTPLLDDENIIIQGFQITADTNTTGDIAINSQIIAPQPSDIQSTIIDTGTLTVVLGENYDRWGTIYDDIDIDGIQIQFSLQNMGLTETTLELSNIQLTIYYNLDQTGGAPGYTINGDHSRLYNIMLDEDETPRGTENEINYAEVTGADGKYATRSNIKEKTIKLKFNIIHECLDLTNELMDMIINWMSNERDQYNKPIPNTIIFDLDPEKQYHYLLEKPINAKRVFEDFECDCELIIPDGVAESVNPRVTSMIGTNNGITRTYPVIQFVADGSESISIIESIEGQTLIINHEFTENTVLIYDSSTKTLKGVDDTDYTEYIDINSNRLVINNKYDFTDTTGATITTITYNERY